MNRLTVTIIAAASLIAGFEAGHFTNANRYQLLFQERRVIKFDRATGKLWWTYPDAANMSWSWIER
jgi:hypothetical protein